MVSQGGSFTTDSSGKVLFYPYSVQGGTLYLRCVEGQVNLSQYDYDEMDLNYIQSVGDLYVDESGEPILDEEGNEQYKLELISNDGNSNSNKTTILLPQPLMKFENSNISGRPVLIYDKLYKNLSTSTYFVDSYAIYKEFDGSEAWTLQDFHSTTDNRFVLNNATPEYDSKVGETRAIRPYCNKQTVRKNSIEGTYLSLWFSKSEFPTLASFKESLSKTL